MMVTPIHDQNWQSWSGNVTEIKNALSEYRAEAFQDYLSRGWCRLEMFFNTNISLDKKLERHKVFAGRLRQIMKAEGRRPHLLFGTREMMLMQEDPVLLRVSDADFDRYNPGGEDSVTKDPKDKEVIRGYVEELYSINKNLRVCTYTFIHFIHTYIEKSKDQGMCGGAVCHS
jgi:hypothetical protein